jgi:glycogen synthase kinase 3 beta
VYLARVQPAGASTTTIEDGAPDYVAIKKVLQDKRYKNRELQLMMLVRHPNVVAMRHHYYSNGDRRDELYLNLVLDFVPDTVQKFYKTFTRARQQVPIVYVKLFSYQLLRSMLYLHSPDVGICHRDVKPHNVLVDPNTGVLKLCDLGSAKQLVAGEANVAYICSRYYRAPELILGATEYTTAVDLWSVGCVVAELLLGQPLFMGDTSEVQLVEIIRVLGTPTRDDLRAMCRGTTSQSNATTTELLRKVGNVRAQPWRSVFPSHVPQDCIDLVSTLVQFQPNLRIKPAEALCHPVFDEIIKAQLKLPSGAPLPPLTNFQPEELRGLTPQHLAKLGCAPK